MTVRELMRELDQYNPHSEIEIEYSYFNCMGHGPDEYCYCSDKIVRRPINHVIAESIKKKDPHKKTIIIYV